MKTDLHENVQCEASKPRAKEQILQAARRKTGPTEDQGRMGWEFSKATAKARKQANACKYPRGNSSENAIPRQLTKQKWRIKTLRNA